MHEQTRCFPTSTSMTAALTTMLTIVMSAITPTQATAQGAPQAAQAPAAPLPAALVPAVGVPMPIWPGGAPGALGTADEDIPTLTLYTPEMPAATGAAVIVCPGGSYTHLSMDNEGKKPAEWFNSLGVTAFVLKYRLGPRYHHPVMLQDVQRAIRIVRAAAPQLHIQADRLGIMGFSAGGHLASTAATHFDDGQPAAADPIDRASSRPDFAVLVYPVITLTDPYGHAGSRKNLLGETPDPALIELLSNEKQVTSRTPPTFIFQTDDDQTVRVENALLFFEAMKKAGVPGELHVYQHGKHGAGLGQNDPILSSWPARLADWLRLRELLPTPASWPAPPAPPAR